jgi:hypothetical protein
MAKNVDDEESTHPGLDPPLPVLVLQESRHVSGSTRHTIHPSNLQLGRHRQATDRERTKWFLGSWLLCLTILAA